MIDIFEAFCDFCESLEELSDLELRLLQVFMWTLFIGVPIFAVIGLVAVCMWICTWIGGAW